MKKKLAPVAIFVYNRLKNTKQVIEALQKNTLARETDIFIFSDGGNTHKNKKRVDNVRQYLKTIDGFKSVSIIKRETNYYIERNITEGITTIVDKFGKIIVLEDDGVTAKGFLTFMNRALDFYEQERKIMHIATFTFIKMPNNYNKTFFWTYSENSGGGWGTWKNRWDKFTWFQNEEDGLSQLTEKQKRSIELDGNSKSLSFLKLTPIPWDICWNIAINKHDGLSVNSPWPLIKNNGLYNGTHFTILNRLTGKNLFEIELPNYDINDIVFETNISENNEAKKLLKEFYSRLNKKQINPLLHYIIRILVLLKITKLLKRIFS